MELMLPVALLADVHVAWDSIGTLVLSISTCYSLFRPAGMPDSSNRWVPGSTGSRGLLTPKLRDPYLSFSLKSLTNGHKGPRRFHRRTCSMT